VWATIIVWVVDLVLDIAMGSWTKRQDELGRRAA
jgi:hypothetical protein